MSETVKILLVSSAEHKNNFVLIFALYRIYFWNLKYYANFKKTVDLVGLFQVVYLKTCTNQLYYRYERFER